MFSLSVLLALLCLRSVTAELFVCFKPFSFNITQKINIHFRLLNLYRIQPVMPENFAM